MDWYAGTIIWYMWGLSCLDLMNFMITTYLPTYTRCLDWGKEHEQSSG